MWNLNVRVIWSSRNLRKSEPIKGSEALQWQQYLFCEIKWSVFSEEKKKIIIWKGES